MATTVYKTWTSGEVLTASDLNQSFLQIINNALALISPLTGSLDADGNIIVMDSDGDSSVRVTTDDRYDLYLNGVSLFRWDGTVASPVNGLDWIASAAGSAVQVKAVGSDTDISINAVPKGAGTFQINGTAVSAPDSENSILMNQVFS